MSCLRPGRSQRNFQSNGVSVSRFHRAPLVALLLIVLVSAIGGEASRDAGPFRLRDHAMFCVRR
jgi:hypothetical protein